MCKKNSAVLIMLVYVVTARASAISAAIRMSRSPFFGLSLPLSALANGAFNNAPAPRTLATPAREALRIKERRSDSITRFLPAETDLVTSFSSMVILLIVFVRLGGEEPLEDDTSQPGQFPTRSTSQTRAWI